MVGDRGRGKDEIHVDTRSDIDTTDQKAPKVFLPIISPVLCNGSSASSDQYDLSRTWLLGDKTVASEDARDRMSEKEKKYRRVGFLVPKLWRWQFKTHLSVKPKVSIPLLLIGSSLLLMGVTLSNPAGLNLPLPTQCRHHCPSLPFSSGWASSLRTIPTVQSCACLTKKVRLLVGFSAPPFLVVNA